MRGMLLRHETTPGYARLVRRRQRHQRLTGRLASAIVAVVLLAAIAAAAIAQPGLPTTFALGIGLVLYVLASFGLEEPPPPSHRLGGPRGVSPVHHRRADDVDWERLDESITG